MIARASIVTVFLSTMIFVMCPPATAELGHAGSLLLFPYFDNTADMMTIMTITNNSYEEVDVRLVCIPETDCSPVDHWIHLTRLDTFTFMFQTVFPYLECKGFLYAYVVDGSNTKKEKKADCLMGQELVFGRYGNAPVHFTVNAVTFQAGKLHPDGNLYLDGIEYSMAPEQVFFPRFFGQNLFFGSRVALINLTGGTYFTANAITYMYNDNEEVFSTSTVFDCFDLRDLVDISPVTKDDYLRSTAHDPAEPLGFNNFVETGYMHIRGQRAENPNGSTVITDASIYAVLIEGIAGLGFCSADLPVQEEDTDYNNAMLWSEKYNGGPN